MVPVAYDTMSAKRHGIIAHWGGSGLRPRITLAIRRKITALRLFYHLSPLCATIIFRTLNPPSLEKNRPPSTELGGRNGGTIRSAAY